MPSLLDDGGFPDDWTADQADSNRYKQMGNAVAVPVVSWIVDRLITKRLVEKTACLSDKRLVDITLSKNGIQLLEKLDKFNDQIDAILKGIHEKEASTVNQILDKLREVGAKK